jgi:hypothetical protein
MIFANRSSASADHTTSPLRSEGYSHGTVMNAMCRCPGCAGCSPGPPSN